MLIDQVMLIHLTSLSLQLQHVQLLHGVDTWIQVRISEAIQ
jgi:hypothetical protein